MKKDDGLVRASGAHDEHTTGDRGASVVEYALLIAMIALVCVLAVTSMGDSTSARFQDTAAKVTAASGN